MNTHDLIVGWDNLEKFTGFYKDWMRNRMRLYDFPKPIKERHGKVTKCVWNRTAVRNWLDKNGESNARPTL